jgi:type III pantothenate kinase
MILLLDAGNSRLKWATLVNGCLARGGAIAYDKDRLQLLMENTWRDIPDPDRILVANVLGDDFIDELEHLVKMKWGITVEYASSSHAAFGVINAYPDPDRLGVDRWATFIAARHEYSGALCIVDCGTALTLDFIAADGQHQGGLIIPGFSMMQTALLEGTAGIGDKITSSRDHGRSILPDDTAGAVHGGALYACIALIDRVVDDVSLIMDNELISIITGGDAAVLIPLLRKSYIHEPDLVLKGLAVMAGSGG